MVVEFLMNMIIGVIRFIFGVIPNLPAMPTFLTDGVTWVTTAISSVLGLFSYIYTPALFIFIITAVFVTLNLKNIYHLVMFVARKLPIGTK